jgi:ribosomal protein S18 acetylase RimI-like enzyme
MEPQSIIVRPANPTIEEGQQFATYMNSASGGGFKKMFGRRFEEIVSNAYLKPNHDLSYETALFAEIEAEIVGMVSGYSAEQYRQLRKDVVKQVAGRSRFRITLILTMIAPMMRFLHTYDNGDFYVEFLAVNEACRGQGIGSTLMQAVEDRARECGATQLAIDVARRNKVAQRLYERIGFTAIRQWPKTRLVRPNILRMIKPL